MAKPDDVGWRLEDRAEVYEANPPILGYSTIQVIGHALDRMKARDVTLVDILKVLREPDKTGLPTQPGRERYRRNKTARVAIDVVFERQADRLSVVTTMKRDRRISRRGE
jgi:hypothetical protein